MPLNINENKKMSRSKINGIKFIHVGLQKTGSTWLQEGLFSNHPQLEVYGSLSRVPRQINNHIAKFYSDSFEFDDWITQFKKLVKTSSGKTTGLSNEQFSGHQWSMDQGINLAERIKRVFGDVKIILILRNPVSFIQSGFIQSIKSGSEVRSLDKILGDDRARKNIIKRISFKKLIEAYNENFSEVLVLPYELLKQDESEFIARICSFLEVESIDYSAISDATKNKGISLIAQKIMRIANFIDLRIDKNKRYVNRSLRRIIKLLPKNLKKMEPVTKYYLLKYNGFSEILIPENYTIWKDELSRYNYFGTGDS